MPPLSSWQWITDNRKFQSVIAPFPMYPDPRVTSDVGLKKARVRAMFDMLFDRLNWLKISGGTQAAAKLPGKFRRL
jgi:hypothetical protein